MSTQSFTIVSTWFTLSCRLGLSTGASIAFEEHQVLNIKYLIPLLQVEGIIVVDRGLVKGYEPGQVHILRLVD